MEGGSSSTEEDYDTDLSARTRSSKQIQDLPETPEKMMGRYMRIKKRRSQFDPTDLDSPCCYKSNKRLTTTTAAAATAIVTTTTTTPVADSCVEAIPQKRCEPRVRKTLFLNNERSGASSFRAVEGHPDIQKKAGRPVWRVALHGDFGHDQFATFSSKAAAVNFAATITAMRIPVSTFADGHVFDYTDDDESKPLTSDELVTHLDNADLLETAEEWATGVLFDDSSTVSSPSISPKPSSSFPSSPQTEQTTRKQERYECSDPEVNLLCEEPLLRPLSLHVNPLRSTEPVEYKTSFKLVTKSLFSYSSGSWDDPNVHGFKFAPLRHRAPVQQPDYQRGSQARPKMRAKKPARCQ